MEQKGRDHTQKTGLGGGGEKKKRKSNGSNWEEEGFCATETRR